MIEFLIGVAIIVALVAVTCWAARTPESSHKTDSGQYHGGQNT